MRRKYWQAPAIFALLTMWLVTVSATSAVTPEVRAQCGVNSLAETASAIIQNATETVAGIDPLALTATAIVQQVTDIAAATGTPTPQPTLNDTQAAAATATSIDPLALTATSIVAGATRTAIAIDASSATLTPQLTLNSTQSAAAAATAIVQLATLRARGIDPLAATATAIVEGATTTAFAINATRQAEPTTIAYPTNPRPCPTQRAQPLPTLSADQIAALQHQMLITLTTDLGFYHPMFEDITANLARMPFYYHDYPFTPEIATTEFTGNKYVAAEIPASVAFGEGQTFESRFPTDGVFIFRIPDGSDTPLLIYTFVGADRASEFLNLFPNGLDTGYMTNAHRRDAYREPHEYGFQDVNKNGLPDLAFTANPGGNTPWGRLILVEIEADGQIRDITPQVPEEWGGFYMDGFADPNSDGVWELRMADVANAALNLYHPQMYDTRWFGWNGSAYVDITSQMADFYQPDIDAFMAQLDGSGPCFRPTDEMSWALAHYFELGQLRQAWTTIEPRLGWDQCSADQWTDYGEEIQFAEAWVNYTLDREGAQ